MVETERYKTGVDGANVLSDVSCECVSKHFTCCFLLVKISNCFVEEMQYEVIRIEVSAVLCR